jgi:C_GCAxxG_C_C family probable redox protein
MSRGDKAKELFLEGYNCSQAVVCAFTDLTGLDISTSAKVASSFGGGLARLREVCGTVSGAAMVLGLIKGYDDVKDPSKKAEHYRFIRSFAETFANDNGSIICRELLKGVKTTPGGDPEPRTEEFYKRRPCPELVKYAADLVEKMLEDTGEEPV